MTLQGPDGKTYEWTKSTPPTAEDIAALQAHVAPQSQPATRPLPTRDQLNDIAWNGTPEMRQALQGSGPTAKNAALTGGYATAGAVLGTAVAPGPGTAIGAGLGGMLGDVLGQETDPGYDANKPGLGIRKGQVLASGLTSAVAPGSGSMAFQAAKIGSVNTAAQFLAKKIDSGETLTKKEATLAFTFGAVSPFASRILDNASANRLASDSLYEARDNAFRKLRPEGAKVPPFELDRGSDTLSSIGGKAAFSQQAIKDNQPVWNKLAREDLGLSKEALPILPETYGAVRKSAYEPYETLQRISEDAKDKLVALQKEKFTAGGGHELAVQMDDPATRKLMDPLVVEAGANVSALKEARIAARTAFENMKAQKGTYEQWKAAEAVVDDLDDKILKAAQSVGDEKLVERLNDARVKLSKAFTYQYASNPTTGLVDPSVLGAIKEAQVKATGRTALTGRAEDIADFALAFRRQAAEAGATPAPGVNNLNAGMSVMAASQGTPGGFLAAFVNKTMGAPIRKAYLSKTAQNYFARPVPAMESPQARFARYLTANAGR